VYRGTRSAAAPLDYCNAMTLLVGGTAGTSTTDTEVPAAGSCYYYLIRAVDGSAIGGTLGSGTCAERTRPDYCPGP
jgi:hypothetical protein